MLLSLQDFRATKRFCDDLPAFYSVGPDDMTKTGFIYADFATIEKRPDGALSVVVYRDYWESEDIRELERILYVAFYIGEAAEPGCTPAEIGACLDPVYVEWFEASGLPKSLFLSADELLSELMVVPGKEHREKINFLKVFIAAYDVAN